MSWLIKKKKKKDLFIWKCLKKTIHARITQIQSDQFQNEAVCFVLMYPTFPTLLFDSLIPSFSWTSFNCNSFTLWVYVKKDEANEHGTKPVHPNLPDKSLWALSCHSDIKLDDNSNKDVDDNNSKDEVCIKRQEAYRATSMMYIGRGKGNWNDATSFMQTQEWSFNVWFGIHALEGNFPQIFSVYVQVFGCGTAWLSKSL